MKLNYKEAYDKIIDAYFKNEIKPCDSKFCFCGTLSPDPFWGEESSDYPYTRDEYSAMEAALFSGFDGNDLNREGFKKVTIFPGQGIRRDRLAVRQIKTMKDTDEMLSEFIPDYEDQLFKGMCAALDVLKEIHRSRGENVDEELKPFVKRKLETV